jgi:acyl-CoA reductase-like NAD-dependent aldehyde dehydrogenase
VCATSDLPAGVLNIVTGDPDELMPHASVHREFDGNFLVSSQAEVVRDIEAAAANHVKRQLTVPAHAPAWWHKSDAQDVRWMQAFLEIKTAWHTMGQ